MKYSQLAFFVTALLSSYGETPLIKLTHFQEECSGCGALTAGVREYSFKALRRDKLYHPYFDLLTAIGFLTTLAAVRSLVCGGVYWAAPPCSTWIWLSRSTTGRSLTRPRGSRIWKKVRRANRLIRRLLYICEYLFQKKVHYVIENPVSSLVWSYRPMEEMLKRHNAFSVSVPLGAYGGPLEKRVTLYTTCPWIQELGTTLDPTRRERLARIKSHFNIEIVKKHRDKVTGKVKVAGGRHLASTAAYPIGLGLKVGSLLQKHMQGMAETIVKDNGLTFHDTDDCSSDSGIEHLLD